MDSVLGRISRTETRRDMLLHFRRKRYEHQFARVSIAEDNFTAYRMITSEDHADCLVRACIIWTLVEKYPGSPTLSPVEAWAVTAMTIENSKYTHPELSLCNQKINHPQANSSLTGLTRGSRGNMRPGVRLFSRRDDRGTTTLDVTRV